MPSPSHFLACDWGTSSFRLRLVRRSDLAVTGTFQNGEGAKTLHGRLLERGTASDPAARDAEFSKVLRSAIAELDPAHPQAMHEAPVVISGMASSTIGWRTVPYATLPCRLDGSSLRREELAPLDSHRIWLVSGLASDTDIMRGEECEILGVLALPEFADLRRDSLVVLPGTHSKHVRIQDQALGSFRTFMTGELLELLSTQSLLRASVPWPPAPLDDSTQTDFRSGVLAARDSGLARNLFQIRVRSVLHAFPTAANGAHLAGLLIGAELLDLDSWNTSAPVLLAASTNFSRPYRLAAETLGLTPRLVVASPDQLLAATLRAQALALDRILS